MTIVYGANRKFYPRAVISIRSCLDWNPDADIILLAEDDKVEGLDGRVKVIKYDKEKILRKVNKSLFTERLSEVIFLKLMLAELLPDVDRCLWLDCDTIVNSKLDDLNNISMSHLCYRMVPERGLSFKLGVTYFNAGVILCNLDYIRFKNMEDHLFMFLREHKVVYFEQDAINFGAREYLGMLPTEYNACNCCCDVIITKDPKIIHYALEDNYWTGESLRGHYWKRYMNG